MEPLDAKSLEPIGARQEPVISEPPFPEPVCAPAGEKVLRRWDAVIKRLPRDQPIIGAEIGIYKGDMSEALLSRMPNLTLYMIDRWTAYPEEERVKHVGRMIYESAQKFAGFEQMTRRKVARFGDRARIHKGNSVDMAKKFPARFFDFVFIDANHQRNFVDADIQAWQAHLKPGGLLCGHDYDPKNFPGVVEAVTSRFGKEIHRDVSNTWFKKLEPSGYYKRKFLEIMGRPPDVANPETHSEFLMRKMLTEDTDLMVQTGGKLGVRDYAREKIGGKYCLPLVYRGGVPDKIPGQGNVIKISNAADRNIFLVPGNPMKPKTIRETLGSWLKKRWLIGGLHYYRIKPEILAEPIVGNPLTVHKVHTWRGEAHYIHSTLYAIDPAGKLKINGITWHDLLWRPLPMINRGHPNIEFARPECLEEMIEATRVLAEPFDHVRVDWLVKGREFWINELTHCSGGAEPSVFDPPSWQYEFGKRWKEAGC
jgi:hypothetical protein